MQKQTTPKIATLEDVAREAGVSTATVSRCLNKETSVRETTRKRVLEVVNRLGYTPNFGARALAAKQTHMMGAIIPTMENAIFAAGVQAFQNELNKAGFTLVVASSSYQVELEEAQIRRLVARGADALFLIGEERDPSIYDLLARKDIPYVIGWSFQNNHAHKYVGFDNYRAAFQAAEAVIGLGHRHIGVISGLTNGNDRAKDRLRGFRDACAKNGVALAGDAVHEVAYNFEAAAEAFEKVYTAHPEISAIVCGNDVLAVGAMKHAKAKGLKLPEDMSFIGFDDIEISDIISPALSTVHVPHRQMGRISAEKLIGALEHGERDFSSVELETRIVMRESLIKKS